MVVTYSINDINPYIIRCGTVNGSNCPSPGTCNNLYDHISKRFKKAFLLISINGSML